MGFKRYFFLIPTPQTMNLKTISSLLLAIAGASNAASSPAFVPKTVAAAGKTALLSLRGGAGPIPEDAMAKAITGLTGLQGAYDYLAPGKSSEMYGMKSSKMSEYIITGLGAYCLGSAITMYAMIFHDMPALKAIGLSVLPGIVNQLKALLNDVPTNIGIANGGQYLNLAVMSFVAYALLTGADYATNVAKGFAGYIALTMLQSRLAPKSAFKTWGCPVGSASENCALKIMAHAGLAYAVLVWYLVNGADTLTALGYSCVPVLVSLLEFIASGELKAIGMDITKIYPWIVLMCAGIVTLAVEGTPPPVAE